MKPIWKYSKWNRERDDNMAAAKKNKPVEDAENCSPATSPPQFTKQSILTFDKYAARRDLLSVLLKDGKGYTEKQVDELISSFMSKKGKVK